MADTTTPATIKTSIDGFRQSLFNQVELAAGNLHNYLLGWGHTSSFDAGADGHFDVEQFRRTLSTLLTAQETRYQAIVTQRQGNRELAAQGKIDGLADIPYNAALRYDATDYSGAIVPDDDKNLAWTALEPEDFKQSLWQGTDIVTLDDLKALKDLVLSVDTQLAMTEESLEFALDEMEHEMDMAGADIGMMGYRKANSYLKMAQMNAIKKVEANYHTANRKTTADSLAFIRANVAEALGMLARLDGSHMEYNSALARVYASVGKMLFEVKGLTNDINIETFAVTKASDQKKNATGTAVDLALLAAQARQIVSSFEVKYAVTMAEWEAEAKRVEDEYLVESTNAGLDEKERNRLLGVAEKRLKYYTEAANAQLKYDQGLMQGKAEGLKHEFDKRINLATSATSTKIGMNVT